MKSVFAVALAVVSFSQAFAAPVGSPATAEPVAKLEQVMREHRILAATATLIRSRPDYDRFMTHFGANSPLSQLPAERRAQFEASLTFGPQGLSGFDYTALENDLSQSQIYAALVPFGMQKIAVKHVLSWVNFLQDPLLYERFGAKRDGQKFFSFEDDVDNSHKDYYCLSRGTCATTSGYICTQNC